MISARSLLYSSVGNPKIFNLSEYALFFRLLTNLVALHCMFSIAIISFLYMGLQILIISYCPGGGGWDGVLTFYKQ